MRCRASESNGAEVGSWLGWLHRAGTATTTKSPRRVHLVAHGVEQKPGQKVRTVFCNKSSTDYSNVAGRRMHPGRMPAYSRGSRAAARHPRNRKRNLSLFDPSGVADSSAATPLGSDDEFVGVVTGGVGPVGLDPRLQAATLPGSVRCSCTERLFATKSVGIPSCARKLILAIAGMESG